MREAFLNYIQKHTSRPELLAALAEEATEVAQAALKVRRALTQDLPTPVNAADAMDKLREEITDLSLCAEVLDMNEVDGSLYDKKLERWVGRLVGKRINDGE